MNVTKMDICSRISKKLDIPTGDLKPVVETFMDEILHILSEDRRIEVRGFGVFCVKRRKQRVGRNPRTGQSVVVPECDSPMFKFSKEALETFYQRRKTVMSRRL